MIRGLDTSTKVSDQRVCVINSKESTDEGHAPVIEVFLSTGGPAGGQVPQGPVGGGIAAIDNENAHIIGTAKVNCKPSHLTGDTNNLIIFCSKDPGMMYFPRLSNRAIRNWMLSRPATADGYDGAFSWSAMADGRIFRW